MSSLIIAIGDDVRINTLNGLQWSSVTLDFSNDKFTYFSDGDLFLGILRVDSKNIRMWR